MKFRRFCTVFLLLALLLTQLWPVTAYAVEDIQLDAKAALLVDGATGTVLLDQDAHTKQYPASITKVMTALLVFEAIDRGELRLSDPITASANSVAGLPDDASRHRGRRDADGGAAAVLPAGGVRQRGEQHSGRGRQRQRHRLCGADEPAGTGAGLRKHPFRQHLRPAG